ncbi:methyltransferase family protein [Labedella gwakjiensis]|uniref:Class I SAM-dependent methyltransferase n=1 Tax=Labedella gwakjiensis TaxID=390269 RepID=A0A2P8GWS5_9MICO|nr:class I SAM-dependent methyltransferase [Labedella gwakjiensis]PSL38421.1 methyltransferase family protein [Labedella gwakjiensis]RUQ87054.1 class I SAM-dependent methyltransferase [Labedella gwakjiensis]
MADPSPLDDVRRAYDAVAEDYAELLRDELGGKPLDRALLGAFAERVAATGDVRVIDAGCGPGRIAGHLRRLGLDVSGVDLSPGMVAIARRTYPDVDFAVGSLGALETGDASSGGVLAWYSIIHTETDGLAAVFEEFARVVVPGGWVLLAFQIGGERVRLVRPYGHDVELDAIRHDVDVVESALGAAGFTVESRTVREPAPPERVRQAYVFAQRAW